MTPSDFSFKDGITISISVAALGMSLITFYWTTFYKRRAFFLIRTSSFFGSSPQFVLVNGGKTDLLVTEAICWLTVGDAGSMPDQQILIDGGSNYLVSAGKSTHWMIKLSEPLDVEIARRGTPVPNHEDYFESNVDIEVHWIDSNATAYRKTVRLSKIWINASGVISTNRPIGAKFDMYENNRSGVFSQWLRLRDWWHQLRLPKKQSSQSHRTD